MSAAPIASEKRDWLRLSRTENVGPISFKQLLQRFGTAKAALEALPEIAARGSKKTFKIPAMSLIDDEIARANKLGIIFIAKNEPEYPEALAAIEDAPPIIAVRGNPALLHKRSIGIVGARNASLNGRKMADMLARDMGSEGIITISGLARGIDTAAHQGSLATGTVAVVAGGVDVVYPQENQKLYEQIIEQGCVISDQPLGLEPYAKLFPRRNRLISGLALGVIVVEAALQSGSLITARMALEQGREVFAVPGSPLDPRCTGTNDLIRQGAILTESAKDVMGHIHAPKPSIQGRLCEPSADDFQHMETDEADMDGARDIIIECLSPSPVAVDELIRECALPAAVVLTVLLELELAGHIERQAGNRVALSQNAPISASSQMAG